MTVSYTTMSNDLSYTACVDYRSKITRASHLRFNTGISQSAGHEKHSICGFSIAYPFAQILGISLTSNHNVIQALSLDLSTARRSYSKTSQTVGNISNRAERSEQTQWKSGAQRGGISYAVYCFALYFRSTGSRKRRIVGIVITIVVIAASSSPSLKRQTSLTLIVCGFGLALSRSIAMRALTSSR